METGPSSPHPWRGHVQLSVEAIHPSDRQSPPWPKSRLSPSRRRSKHRASSFDDVLVDEFDMLLDTAATIIQAAWRGYQARQQLCTQYHAAVAIQATWRGFLARERLASQRAETAAWQGYGIGPERTWARPAHTWTRAAHTWTGPEDKEEQAAVVIQAHYRGYRVRCVIYSQHLAAATIQAHYRGYRTRQALAENHRAATTIQACWRGYHARQDLAQAQVAPCSTDSRQDFFSNRCQGHLEYTVTTKKAPSPASLAHRRHALAGDQGQLRIPARQTRARGAGGERLPKPPGLAQRGDRTSPPWKRCPQCRQSATVRVLVGVGKGTAYQSEDNWEEAPGHLSTGYSVFAEEAPYTAGHGSAQTHRVERAEGAAYTGYHRQIGTPSATRMVAAEQAAPNSWQQDWAPKQRGPACGAHTATQCRAPGRGPTSEWRAAQGHSSTSWLLTSTLRQDTGGTDAAWLTSSFWPSEAKGERRVFKTRKQYWQLTRAATRIQAFWRGCQMRRALREQQEAAIRIQAVFRGYRTRADLTAAGVLSGAETEDEGGTWSCQPGRYC